MSTQPTEPAPSGGPPPISSQPITPDERTWGTMAHVSSIIAMFVGGLTVLGPLIVWLVKKNESAYVAHHGREALNFQITMLFVTIVCALSLFCFIGFVLLPLAFLANVILSIVGAMWANEGQLWTYPFSIRLVT
jgi:uncharacterized Tic20 family protein